MTNATQDHGTRAETWAHRHASRLHWLARAGYAARGIVYIMVGGMAILAAIGEGGRASGTKGALRMLTDEPYGQAMLTFLALGLVLYAVWRVTQAVLNADDHDHDAKGYVIRIGLGVSAVTHVLLSLYALSLTYGWWGAIAGSGGGDGQGNGGGTSSMSAWLLSQPAGQWLLGAVGLFVGGAGVAQFIKGWREGYRKRLKADPKTMDRLGPICKTGLIARGIVFVLIAAFIITAAFRANPEEARGLGQTLQWLRQQPYGAWLLGAAAIGLLLFGVYSIVEAVYRKITVAENQPAQ